MRNSILSVFTVGLFVALAGSSARAQCVEDPREVKLDKDNIVRLKSYLCRAGQDQNAPQIKVEFHRLAEAAASILIGKQPLPESFKAVFGNPLLVENETFKSYADLLQKFGENYENSTYITLNVSKKNADGASADSDTITSTGEETKRKTRTILSPGGFQSSFPNVDESRLLARKIMPPNYHYDYRTNCDDVVPDGEPPKAPNECEQWNLNDFTTVFWRSMTSSDLDNFRKNLDVFNRLVKSDPKTKDDEINPSTALETEKQLKFAKYVAGDDWPANFLILHGEKSEGCGDNEDPSWAFYFYPRNIQVDTIAVTNVSKQPVTLNGAFGGEVASPRLRPASAASAAAGAGGPIGMNAVSIAPGQTVLMPMRIVLPAELSDSGPDNRAGPEAVHAKVGANGFAGDADAFGPPNAQDYAFGPEISVRGLLVDNKTVDLAERADNILEVTLGSGYGSCPYLLAWDETDRDWVNHGKVLHKGQSKAREYSETKTFGGFRARFRLEEREPEIAYIDHAELVAALKNGKTLTLKPGNAKLAARDGDYLELMWGEGAELRFALPEGVAEDDVAESRLTLTGYYERYSSLMAKKELDSKPRRATDFSPLPGRTRLHAIRALSRSAPVIFVQQARGNP